MSGLNFPRVNIENFKEIVRAQLKEKNYRPIFGLGLGGIGKTESIMELAKEEGIGYIDIRLLLYNETDLKGIPYPDEHHIATIWLQNNILPKAENDGEKGILVFDEITSCPRSVRTAAYQLLNERKLGEYELPEGWLVVCLGNGPEDGGDFNGMEGNFLNRCSVYSVVPSVSTWCDWATKSGINPLVVAYIRFKGDDFHTYNPDDDLKLFASPRSWKAVSDILNANGDTENNITCLRVLGNVGEAVGQSFLNFCKFKTQSVDAQDILRGKAGYNFSNKEALIITVNSLIKACRDLFNEYSAKPIDDDLLHKMANVINWLSGLTGDMAAEMQLLTFKDISNLNQALMAKITLSPKFRQICPKCADFLRKFGSLIS